MPRNDLLAAAEETVGRTIEDSEFVAFEATAAQTAAEESSRRRTFADSIDHHHRRQVVLPNTR